MTESSIHCDFYDWATRRRCDQPAHWETHQNSAGVGRVGRVGQVGHYCDVHRPPRAHPLAKPSATRTDRSRNPGN